MRFKAPKKFASITTTRVPKARCPSCQTLVDAATHVNFETLKPQRPKPGCFTICTICGAYNCFTEALGLRRATDEELREAREIPKLAERLAFAAQTALEWRLHKEREKNWFVKDKVRL